MIRPSDESWANVGPRTHPAVDEEPEEPDAVDEEPDTADEPDPRSNP